jgi:IclR family acetate operon transcriptional repressor
MAHSNLVQSLERGLDILERVARSGDGLGVREVADGLGLKPPTVHNLIRTLTARGYLRRDDKPVRYRLGPAFAEIRRACPVPRIPAGAERELLALQQAHPDGVFTLAESSAQSVVVVLRVSPEQPGVIQHPVAHTLSPYGSSSALLFQALWPEEQRHAFTQLHAFWDSSAAALWKTPEALATFLDGVRREGVAVTLFHGETTVKLAVPVYGSEGALATCLGSAVPSAGLTAARRRNLIGELKAAATRLSKESPHADR